QAIAAAYGVNPALATNQTVGIVDAGRNRNIQADLHAFDLQYGLSETQTSFSVLNQLGNASPLPAVDPRWTLETALDVEAVRGLGHACNIILIEAKSSSLDDLAIAVNTAVAKGASVVSLSWGGAESTGYTPYAPSFDHPGVPILVSTGDDGMYDWDYT